MTTGQRKIIRGFLITAGFKRITHQMPENPIYYDKNQKGAYREVWCHNLDNTILTVDWDNKTEETV